MRVRCYDSKNKSFPNYGGRGIMVCEQWRYSFDTFLTDMGIRPVGMSLDRIDNSGPYSPDNCRWAIKQEQANNTRANRIVEHNGRAQTIAQWSRESGVSQRQIWKRLTRGWSMHDTLTRPLRGSANHVPNVINRPGVMAAAGRKGAEARWHR